MGYTLYVNVCYFVLLIFIVGVGFVCWEAAKHVFLRGVGSFGCSVRLEIAQDRVVCGDRCTGKNIYEVCQERKRAGLSTRQRPTGRCVSRGVSTDGRVDFLVLHTIHHCREAAVALKATDK